MDGDKDWKQLAKEEVKYWESVLSGNFPNKVWVETYRKRIDGVNIAPDFLHPYLKGHPRVLDAGSGPITGVGAFYKNIPINITAIDPLARDYAEILDRLNYIPIVRTEFGLLENLLDFVDGSFDLIYSCNALDHNRDPISLFKNLIKICRKGGKIIIECAINDGLFSSYWGTHQWNIMPAANKVLLWNKKNECYILNDYLGEFNISSYKHEKVYKRWLRITIKK